MNSRRAFASKRNVRLLGYVAGLLASTVPVTAQAATASNPICPDNTALFDPGSGQDIVVPPGFKVSVFKSGLNFPTGIAFRKTGATFEVYVLESGHGLPSRCNDETSSVVGGAPARKIPSRPTSSYSIKMETSSVRLASQHLRGSAFRRRAPLSTSPSRMESTAAACLRPTRTSRCERRGTTTARAL